MTEQELKDGEAYQASPAGTAAALVFELERVTEALAATIDDDDTMDSLLTEISSIGIAFYRLGKLHAALVLRKTDVS